jgi:hypothetical protein
MATWYQHLASLDLQQPYGLQFLQLASTDSVVQRFRPKNLIAFPAPGCAGEVVRVNFVAPKRAQPVPKMKNPYAKRPRALHHIPLAGASPPSVHPIQDQPDDGDVDGPGDALPGHLQLGRGDAGWDSDHPGIGVPGPPGLDGEDEQSEASIDDDDVLALAAVLEGEANSCPDVGELGAFGQVPVEALETGMDVPFNSYIYTSCVNALTFHQNFVCGHTYSQLNWDASRAERRSCMCS